MVAGSNPARGANEIRYFLQISATFRERNHVRGHIRGHLQRFFRRRPEARPTAGPGVKPRDSEWSPNARSNHVVSGISAVKTTFDALRSAIGLVKDTKDLLPKSNTTASITAALATAESSSRIAEAEVAKALGYELCKCQFPPTPMLTVGSIDNPAAKMRGPVFECPRCGFNTDGPWSYPRIAPPRAT